MNCLCILSVCYRLRVDVLTSWGRRYLGSETFQDCAFVAFYITARLTTICCCRQAFQSQEWAQFCVTCPANCGPLSVNKYDIVHGINYGMTQWSRKLIAISLLVVFARGISLVDFEYWSVVTIMNWFPFFNFGRGPSVSIAPSSKGSVGENNWELLWCDIGVASIAQHRHCLNVV